MKRIPLGLFLFLLNVEPIKVERINILEYSMHINNNNNKYTRKTQNNMNKFSK